MRYAIKQILHNPGAPVEVEARSNVDLNTFAAPRQHPNDGQE